MSIKKFGKAFLFPHIAVMILLAPTATVFLIYAMVFLGTESVAAIVAYVLAAYTLTVWCVRLPRLIRSFKKFKATNKYARRWQEDTRLRVNISLYGSLTGNVVYSVFQLWLGVYHASFWFYSMAGYYLSLAVMRFFLVRYTAKRTPGEDLRAELIRYRACGWIFLFMNLAVSLMIFFMVYWSRTFYHHPVTAIALAAHTFSAFTVSIVNVVKYRRYNSPVYSASKIICLAAACVSMLTLESTMLTSFDDGTLGPAARGWMLGISGAVVSASIIAMASYMIRRGTRQLKHLNYEEIKNGKQA